MTASAPSPAPAGPSGPGGGPAPELNVQLVRAVYDAFARRDVHTLFAIFAPDVELRQTGLLPWGGVYTGTEEARRFFALLTGHLDSRVEVERWVPAGDRVAVVGRTRGHVRANARPFDAAFVHVWTVRDGKVAAVEYHVDTPAILLALGAGEGAIAA